MSARRTPETDLRDTELRIQELEAQVRDLESDLADAQVQRDLAEDSNQLIVDLKVTLGFAASIATFYLKQAISVPWMLTNNERLALSDIRAECKRLGVTINGDIEEET